MSVVNHTCKPTSLYPSTNPPIYPSISLSTTSTHLLTTNPLPSLIPQPPLSLSLSLSHTHTHTHTHKSYQCTVSLSCWTLANTLLHKIKHILNARLHRSHKLTESCDVSSRKTLMSSRAALNHVFCFHEQDDHSYSKQSCGSCCCYLAKRPGRCRLKRN